MISTGISLNHNETVIRRQTGRDDHGTQQETQKKSTASERGNSQKSAVRP